MEKDRKGERTKKRKEKGNEERCGAGAKPGSEDHRSETGGRYIDIRISLVVIYHYLYLIMSFSFSSTQARLFSLSYDLIFLSYFNIILILLYPTFYHS